jgi:hypothetical protein
MFGLGRSIGGSGFLTSPGESVSVNSYSPPRRRVSVFGLLGVVGGVILLVVAGQAVKSLVLGDGAPVLPDTFQGRAWVASDQDFGQDDTWRETADDAAGGAGISGRAYGSPADGLVHVTAAHADLTGKLDLTIATDPGQDYGGVRCTRELTLAKPSTRDRFLLCWRTAPDRSVTVLALNYPVSEEELAKDVDTLGQKLG